MQKWIRLEGRLRNLFKYFILEIKESNEGNVQIITYLLTELQKIKANDVKSEVYYTTNELRLTLR